MSNETILELKDGRAVWAFRWSSYYELAAGPVMQDAWTCRAFRRFCQRAPNEMNSDELLAEHRAFTESMADGEIVSCDCCSEGDHRDKLRVMKDHTGVEVRACEECELTFLNNL